MFDDLHVAIKSFSLEAEPVMRPISDLLDAMTLCIEKLTYLQASEAASAGEIGRAYAQQELSAIAAMRDQLLGDLASAAMLKLTADRQARRPVAASALKGRHRPPLVRKVD